MEAFAYVNGEPCELLEDRRLAVYKYFSPGTLVFDGSFSPPRIIPLSDQRDEYGVTTLKLLPNGHYFARASDGTPALLLTASRHRIIIVHNLPLRAPALPSAYHIAK